MWWWAGVALLFAGSVAGTIAWCESMAGMSPWMRMPGQGWGAATAMFAGMWIVMMVAMKLPSLAPRLWGYRQGLGAAVSPGRAAQLTVLVAVAYFAVWTTLGLAAFPVGVALAAVGVRGPLVAAVVVVAAGTLQWSAWKARRLADYRQPPVAIAATAGTALRHGLRLGLDCCASCAGLMAILFVLGVMDLVAMTLVAAAITVERLAPARLRAPRAVGVVAVAGGLVLLLRTV